MQRSDVVTAWTPEKTMGKLETTRWDPADYLETKEAIAAFLEAAFEDGDLEVIVAALDAIARSKGLAEVASVMALDRESLCKALSAEGNPEFATVLKVMKALGLKLHATVGE
jgi:probable addiction module antidote protein